MTRLGDRPTPDLVVLALTALVSAVVVLVLAGTILLEALGRDPGKGADWVGKVVGSLVTGLLGYLAGRSIGGNGDGKAT